MNQQLRQLIKEIGEHNITCDKLIDQRYTTQKYEDRWFDDLFRDYQNTKFRIQLLIELLSNQEDSHE